MQVILLENIKNLGKIGDVVNVKRGFARNYLLKYEKALNASKENIKIVNNKKEQLNKKDLEFKKEARQKFDILDKKKYVNKKFNTKLSAVNARKNYNRYIKNGFRRKRH